MNSGESLATIAAPSGWFFFQPDRAVGDWAKARELAEAIRHNPTLDISNMLLERQEELKNRLRVKGDMESCHPHVSGYAAANDFRSKAAAMQTKVCKFSYTQDCLWQTCIVGKEPDTLYRCREPAPQDTIKVLQLECQTIINKGLSKWSTIILCSNFYWVLQWLLLLFYFFLCPIFIVLME